MTGTLTYSIPAHLTRTHTPHPPLARKNTPSQRIHHAARNADVMPDAKTPPPETKISTPLLNTYLPHPHTLPLHVTSSPSDVMTLHTIYDLVPDAVSALLNATHSMFVMCSDSSNS